MALRSKRRQRGFFRSRANRRRSTHPRWRVVLHKGLRFSAYLLGWVGLYGLGDWSYRWFLSLDYFRLNTVTVETNGQVSESAVEESLRPYMGESLFAISLKELCEEWKSNPWVKEVIVRRHLPSSLSVRLIEYRPIALLRDEGSYYYIDASGIPFKKVEKGESVDFPVLTGIDLDAVLHQEKGALLLFYRGLELLILSQGRSYPSTEQISEIHLEPNFGSTIYLVQSRLAIHFGWDDYEEKWSRLEMIWDHLPRLEKKVKYIDLDYDRMAAVGLL